jgi:hypothetical protein
MAGNGKHAEIVIQDAHDIAFDNRVRHLRNARRSGAVHGHLVALQQVIDAADMIAVMMRDEYCGESQTCLAQPGKYGSRIARIHDTGVGATGFVEHPKIVVVECSDRFYVQHDKPPRNGSYLRKRNQATQM